MLNLHDLLNYFLLLVEFERPLCSLDSPKLILKFASDCENVCEFSIFLVYHFRKLVKLVGNENGEPVIAERQIRIMDKPLGQRDYDDGML